MERVTRDVAIDAVDSSDGGAGGRPGRAMRSVHGRRCAPLANIPGYCLHVYGTRNCRVTYKLRLAVLSLIPDRRDLIFNILIPCRI